MKAIIQYNTDGSVDKTLAIDYNENNMKSEQLYELAEYWEQEDNDGTEYKVEDIDND